MKYKTLLPVLCILMLAFNKVSSLAAWDPAQAIESSLYVNTKSLSVTLSINSSTAECAIGIIGVSDTDSIRGTATLFDETEKRSVSSWTVFSSSSICRNSRKISIKKGHTYKLTFSGTVHKRNGNSETISGFSMAYN